MHMLPLSFQQPFFENARDYTLMSTVKQHFRRSGSLISQIDRNRMALRGANFQPIVREDESALAILRDDLFQLLSTDIARVQEFRDLGPTAIVERKTYLVRFMSQYQAEQLAGACE